MECFCDVEVHFVTWANYNCWTFTYCFSCLLNGLLGPIPFMTFLQVLFKMLHMKITFNIVPRQFVCVDKSTPDQLVCLTRRQHEIVLIKCEKNFNGIIYLAWSFKNWYKIFPAANHVQTMASLNNRQKRPRLVSSIAYSSTWSADSSGGLCKSY